jgi:hypothetical protein
MEPSRPNQPILDPGLPPAPNQRALQQAIRNRKPSQRLGVVQQLPPLTHQHVLRVRLRAGASMRHPPRLLHRVRHPARKAMRLHLHRAIASLLRSRVTHLPSSIRFIKVKRAHPCSEAEEVGSEAARRDSVPEQTTRQQGQRARLRPIVPPGHQRRRSVRDRGHISSVPIPLPHPRLRATIRERASGHRLGPAARPQVEHVLVGRDIKGTVPEVIIVVGDPALPRSDRKNGAGRRSKRRSRGRSPFHRRLW